MQTYPPRTTLLGGPASFASVAAVILFVHAPMFGSHPTLLADDYAAYIANARAIAHATQYGMPGFIVNTDYAAGADTGQAAYPVGFPLLIAPLAVAFSASLPGLLWAIAGLNTLLLALAGGAFARLLAGVAGTASGAAGGVLLGCSPLLLDQGAFRTPSEPAFILAFVLALLGDEAMKRRPSTANAVRAGALVAATTLVRIVAGILLPAASLAMLVRQGRVSRANVVLCAVACALLAGGFAVMGHGYLSSNAAILVSGSGGASGHNVPGAAAIWHNLLDLPGNLSVLWDFAWRPPGSAAPALVHRLTQAGSLIILVAAAIGFSQRVRRGPGAAELFLVGETLFMLILPALQQSPRYYLPMSLLAVYYAFSASARPAMRGAIGAIFLLSVAANLPASITAHQDAQRFAINAPQADAAISWIKANTPSGSVILTHRPRSFVLFAGRAATDFTSSRADGDFLSLARRIGAAYLVVNTDSLQNRAAASALGFGADDAGLNRALDIWAGGFFGGTPGFALVFRNERFRVYAVPAAGAA